MRKLFILLLLFPFQLLAQSPDDSLAQSLVKRHIFINSVKMTMPGFRVQVFYGTQRTKANEIRAEIIQRFPHLPAYIIYQQPNFKLRIGDFKTRLEALQLLDQLQINYPSSFVVRDEVKLPEIN